MECLVCHEDNVLTARFCESCGQALTVNQSMSQSNDWGNSGLGIAQTISPNCQKCASVDLEPDGFCNQCGFRNLVQRDHFEQILNLNFVAISDRGIKHSQNEDYFAIHQMSDERSVLVVCDGVSSSSNPGIASLNASQSACRSIQKSLESGIMPQAALLEGIHQAQSAVTELASELTSVGSGDAPSTTIIAAIVAPSRNNSEVVEVTIAWLGDSRAYWLAPTAGQSQQLSQDHSWCEEMVADGQMSREEAERSLQAHAITRWLGADADDEMKPSLATFNLPRPGQLVLCSDGLWNYASDVSQLHQVLHQPMDTDIITIVRKGIEFALSSGGQDNITIALLNLEASHPK